MNIALAYEYDCDRQYAAITDYDEAISEMIDELLDGEYNPKDFDNAMEAMSKEPIQQMAWTQAMTDSDILLAGEIIKTVSENYWTVKAEKDAPAKLAERQTEMRGEFENSRYG